MGLLFMRGGELPTGRWYDQPMNITLDTFEERIVWLLKQRGMSQKELAARLDVSVQFLNSLVIGRRRPNVKRLTQIATELGTSVDFLALTSDDPAPPDAAAPEPPYYFSAEADAAAQLIDAMLENEAARGSRRDRLQEVIAAGYAMLDAPDIPAANSWWRQYVQVWIDKNSVVEVRWL